MKFGIFYELAVPKPWTSETEHEVYHTSLEQVRLADELGFHSVWAVEHHFLEEYSHCSAPEIFLTACAAQTRNIRLGHGIRLVLPPFNHPVRAAESAAALDIISNGRLEFGTGRSQTWNELGGFLCNPDDTKDMWDEAVRAIPKMWTQEYFSWQGKYFNVPPRNVIPKPYQKPHPPMWVAVSSPETATQAAERGMGMLGVSGASAEEQKKRVQTYRQIIKNCEPVGEFVNEKVGTLNWLYCDEDPKAAEQYGQQLVQGFNYLNAQFVAIRQVYPTKLYRLPGGGARERAAAGAVQSVQRQPAPAPAPALASVSQAGSFRREDLAIGTPQQIIQNMKRWEDMGVDIVTCLISVGTVVPQEKILKSLRLFAEEVIPYFDREAKSKAKEKEERAAAAAPAS
jgi:alkanesulfonate monooxygenase SsuD/methylene tetrahydromethanopterin reductase-like flavin-dependent oxidoreductase (luciferase family)